LLEKLPDLQSQWEAGIVLFYLNRMDGLS